MRPFKNRAVLLRKSLRMGIYPVENYTRKQTRRTESRYRLPFMVPFAHNGVPYLFLGLGRFQYEIKTSFHISDWLLISPYSITLQSNLKVMRITEMIANLRSSRL